MTDYSPNFAACLMSGFTDELHKMAADFAALGLDADDLAKIANVANFLTSAKSGTVGASIAARNGAKLFGTGVTTAGAIAPAAAAKSITGAVAAAPKAMPKVIGPNVVARNAAMSRSSLPRVAPPQAMAA